MNALSFGAVLKAMCLAGVIAGLLTATFHFAFSEPLIDRAVQMEGDANPAAGAMSEHEEEVVSRDGQKVGLFIGYLIYGLSWALLLAVVYHLQQGRFAAPGLRKGAFVFALLVFWACVLLPFLKYPANPPGVGEPDTVEFRQRIYLAIQALGVISTVAAIWGGPLLARRLTGTRLGAPRPWLISAACMALAGLILYFAMPDNPDPVRVPMDFVITFRLFSLAGLALFWTAFGLSFGWLLERFSRPKAVAAATSRAL